MRRRVDGGGRRGEVALDKRSKRDELECGARRIHGARGAVDERTIRGVGAACGLGQYVVDVVDVVGGRARAGEHRARFRVHDHDGALVALEHRFGGFLNLGIDREAHVVAGRLDSRHAVHYVGPACEVRIAFQRVVLRGLDARCAVNLRVVSHQVSCERTLRIFARVSAIVCLHAVGQHDAIVCGDGAAFGARFLIERVVVAGVALILVGHKHHNVGEVRYKRREHERERERGIGETFAQGNAAEHARFCGAAVRAVRANGGHAACSVANFRVDAGALVAASQQKANANEACEQGRSALANERQGKACKRNESRNAAHDDERLKHDGHGAAYGHHGRHVAFRASRGRETANAQTQIQKQHGGSAEQARFFGDGGEDEVGLNDGDVFGEAVADAYAHHAAIGQGIERLAQLIAIARCVRERVEPGVHANLHVAEELV